MQKLRILYVSALPLESNTSASIGNNSLIKGLLSLGHSVEIATSKYPNDGLGYDISLNENSKLKTYSFDIGVYRRFYTKKEKSASVSESKGIFFPKLIGILKKEIFLDPFIFWTKKAKLFTDGGHYDIIISGSDPVSSHLFAYNLIRKKRVSYSNWIQIWGDPLYDDINRRNSHLKYYFKLLESKLLKNADFVFYVSENTLDSQRRIFNKYAAKMEFAPRAWLHNIESSPDGEIFFGYFGDFLPSVRNIRPLLEAFSSPDLCTTKLTIAGKGSAVAYSSNIEVYGRLPYNEVFQLERAASALIVLCNLSGNQLPAKVYHYSGTDKPILVILDGDSENIVGKLSKYNRFFFCNNTAHEIAEAVHTIVSGDYAIDLRPVVEFSPSSVAKRILDRTGI